MKHERKRHTSIEMVAKLKVAISLEESGYSLNRAACDIGVARTTYYRWRIKFAGMSAQQIQRMLDLEDENARLRRTLLELDADGCMRAPAR